MKANFSRTDERATNKIRNFCFCFDTGVEPSVYSCVIISSCINHRQLWATPHSASHVARTASVMRLDNVNLNFPFHCPCVGDVHALLFVEYARSTRRAMDEDNAIVNVNECRGNQQSRVLHRTVMYILYRRIQTNSRIL